jgi:hypothetical protein
VRPWRFIIRQFDSEQNDIKAAFMDALVAFLVLAGLTVAYFQTVNFVGTHHPETAQKLFGYVGVTDYMTPSNLGVAALYAGFAGALSLFAILFISTRPARRPRLIRRPVIKTTLAVILAVATTTGIGMALLQSFTIGSALESFATLGFLAVPAALRLTSPSAFAYRCPSPETIVAGWTSGVEDAS